MKIYTKKGDSGKTSLVGGERVSKGGWRIEAYGTLDELCAHLGFLASMDAMQTEGLGGVRGQLEEIISRVMDCSAIVASTDTMLEKLPKITTTEVETLEWWCDALLEGLPQLSHFTLPIGAPEMSYAHVCRTVARRSERAMVRVVDGGETIPSETLSYINRLSDYLYALTRFLQHTANNPEVEWVPPHGK